VNGKLLPKDEEEIFQRLHDEALRKGVYLDVSRDRKSPDDWFVRGLYAMSRTRAYSLGSGVRALQNLFDAADERKKIIRLEPWTSGKRKPGEDWLRLQQRLVKYYKSLGFVVDPSRNGLLVRYPNQGKS
jgi:hypothetical protein